MDQPLNMQDLRLLFQWLKGSAVMFDDHDVEIAKREREDQIELALAHPYLMHTILSLAALEMYHNKPTNTAYFTQATSHNVAALRHARPCISQLEDEHSEALYLFSCFTSLYAFAEPPLRIQSSISLSETDSIRDLLHSFRMGRGILAVKASNESHLEKDRITDKDKSKLQWPNEIDENSSVLQAQYPQLLQLQVLVTRDFQGAHASTLHDALIRLFASMAVLQRKSKNHSSASLIQIWPMHVDQGLFDMWDSDEPIALVLLAYYAVMVDMRSNIWFFQRWPKLILDSVETRLDQKWHEYIMWPRTIIHKLEG